MAIPKIQVTGTVLLPGGAVPAEGAIIVKLHTPGVTSDGVAVGGRQTFVLAADGSLPADFLLTPNAEIVPASWYDVSIRVLGTGGRSYGFPAEKWSIVAGVSPIAIDDVLRIDGTPAVVYGPDAATLAARDQAIAAMATKADVAGDLGGTTASPEVRSTHLAAPLPEAQGGTGGPDFATKHRAQVAAGGHVVQRWEVADAAARLTLSLTAADVGGVARQADDGSQWRCVNHSPATWREDAPRLAEWLASPRDFLSGMTAMTVQRASSEIYVRTPWSATKDLVRRVLPANAATYNNNPVLPSGVRLIPIATAASDTQTAYSSSTDIIAVEGDESPPANFGGSYMGGSHGPNIVVAITATSHGKTAEDVGSEWTDGLSRKFYLVRRVDANTLWVVSENTGTDYLWSFYTSISGSTLTHSSGATHTTDITFTSPTLTQWLPWSQNHVRSVMLDGKVISTNDTYSGRKLEMFDYYNIPNPASALAYIRSKVGSAVELFANDPSVTAQARVELLYTYTPDGGMTIRHRFTALQNMTLSQINVGQATAMTFSGKTIHEYIPKVGAWVGSVKTWNFASVEDVSGTIESYEATQATWAAQADPPDRMTQIVKASGVAESAITIGLSLRYGTGIPTRRLGMLGTLGAVNFYSSRKQYLRSLTQYAAAMGVTTTLHAPQTFDCLSYRVVFNPAALPEATVFATYMDEGVPTIHLDFHQDVTAKVVQLPSAWAGGRILIVEKSSGVTIGSEYVNPSGQFTITVTGGYGYAVLRLV